MKNKEKAISIIKNHNCVIRTKEAIAEGIHPRILYQLRDEGIISELSRGLFKLGLSTELSNLDFITISKKSANSVICLISALSFHQLTTEIPHKVYIALEKDTKSPKIDYPPISIHRFSNASYELGVIEYSIDNIPVKIYNPEKTIVDCFKFRNKIGLDIVLEALKIYSKSKDKNIGKVIKYAKECRVYNVMKPYLEAVL